MFVRGARECTKIRISRPEKLKRSNQPSSIGGAERDAHLPIPHSHTLGASILSLNTPLNAFCLLDVYNDFLAQYTAIQQ